MEKEIKRALISVYHKEGLEPVLRRLHALSVEIISTGGTYDYISSLGIPCRQVEELTHVPSILHGRVKTLHPNVFGGILARRDNTEDAQELRQYNIAPFDLVLVGLYPFEETVASGGTEEEIIEKIDIGGVSLIRAAAKNYQDVLIVSSPSQYPLLLDLLESDNGTTTLVERKRFARAAFAISSGYDSAIFRYFDEEDFSSLRIAFDNPRVLRYGENPHQRGIFFGELETQFDKLQGKELSYNNIQDVASAIELLAEFDEMPTFAILKHTNPCGLSSRETICEAWKSAFEADPESAFGGVLIANRSIDKETAEAIGDLFFEVLVAPDFDTDALPVLMQKNKRILLVEKPSQEQTYNFRSMLGGVLVQEADRASETAEACQIATQRAPSADELEDCIFAQRIVKHCKSNAIVIAKDRQILATGVGQTSRIAALKQAIEKAERFGFDLRNAVAGSDAFFPFSDCVEMGVHAGITAFIQPGGSIRDKESIEKADQLGATMLLSGVRHFKH